MFQMQEFMNGLDQIYQSGQVEKAENYLLEGIRQTENTYSEAALVMYNELIGYYRVTSRHPEGAKCAARSLELIQKMGLQGTLNHGTTMLNIATGFRAAGNYEQAENCYKQAQEIFEKQLTGPDYRLASLHNNLALLYAQTGRLQEAHDRMLAALELTAQLPDMETERAITFTNLGNVCFQMSQPEQAAGYMRQAVELFEQNAEHPDPHYPAALSGLGQASFHEGDLDAAAGYYEKSLNWIEQIYGRTDDWETTKYNLDTVKNLIRRRDAVAVNGMKGLELSKAYYEEVGRPMLEQKYPQYLNRMAIGLVGEGSECLGFDDAHSTDHDFGPGFCIWLTKEDYKQIGKALQADYDALSSEWRGLPVRNTTAEGAGRVGVLEMGAFYQNFTGYAQAPAVKDLQDVLVWSEIQPEMLRTAVNGEVFTDPLGEFTKRRNAFAQYPEPVRLCRLAGALGKMAQAGQYNYGRGRKREDIGMMYSALSEFIQAAAEAGYLLNHSYMPFYKWRIRGMEQFERLTELKTMLEQLMRQSADSPNTEEKIEEICSYIRKELRAQGLSEVEDPFLDSHKEPLLRRMRELAAEKNMSEKEYNMEKLMQEMSESKKALVEQVVAEEWKQFQKVQNEGGEASCQHNWPTFEIMRKSQFYTWNEETLNSYLDDLKEAEQTGWNLVMEKYARMMEHTAPEQYKNLEKSLPERSEMRKKLQQQLGSIYMQWTREMQKQYPALLKRGRHISASEDSEWDTSSETYLQGELGIYSEKTIQLYAHMLLDYLRNDENMVEKNLNYMVHFYGYDSLQAANDRYAQEQ